MREHVIFNTQNVTKMAVFYHDYRALSEEPLAEIVERRRFYEDYLRDLIREAQEEGSVNRDLDPKLAAFTLFGMMNWVYHWYSPAGVWTPEPDRRAGRLDGDRRPRRSARRREAEGGRAGEGPGRRGRAAPPPRHQGLARGLSGAGPGQPAPEATGFRRPTCS